MKYTQVEGNKNLYRDEESTAIINKDSTGLHKAKLVKSRFKNQESEINTLKEEVKEMKEILLQISERMKWQEQ